MAVAQRDQAREVELAAREWLNALQARWQQEQQTGTEKIETTTPTG
ncbi:MAG: hypothetical protein VBE63_24075 [Lamprobacter sp.]|nr:hypothetical protein [Lamprobacter sp.]MEA3642993.1 hypothetical protein [Lamprobacter sp.]